jgi:hypothetical protein
LSDVLCSHSGDRRTALNPRKRLQSSIPTISSTPSPSRSPVSTVIPNPPT